MVCYKNDRLGIKMGGQHGNNLRFSHGSTWIDESKEGLEELIMKVKIESEKTWLMLNVKKIKNTLSTSTFSLPAIDDEELMGGRRGNNFVC